MDGGQSPRPQRSRLMSNEKEQQEKRCSWLYFGRGGECGSKHVTHVYYPKAVFFCSAHARNMQAMGFMLNKVKRAA